MNHLILTHQLVDQAEYTIPQSTACEFSSPLPDKITPIEFQPANPSPPPADSPLTIHSLQQTLQPILLAARAKKQEWIARYEYLNHRQKALEKLAKMANLSETHLQAYLLTKSAHYVNYQANLLKDTNFTLQSYLQTLASEISQEARHLNPKKEVSP